jgi:signal transduction histidine kinase
MTATVSEAASDVTGVSRGRGIDPDRVNILLVDDQPSNLMALSAILEGLGQNLIAAHTGQEALRDVLNMDFAVILLDVQMPEVDGFETAELIRNRERSRHTPIIFLTAYEQNDIQAFKGYALGAVDFLCKPLVPDVLRSKVSVFVELKRMAVKLERQAEQIRETERRERERLLLEERQRWELDRLRAESEKDRKRAEELAAADRRKDEFLAMLGHELRNPLAPILNALHLMRLRAGPDDETAAMRELIDRQARLMTRLVDDLLDVSRITRGSIHLRKSRVNLRDIVALTVDSMRPFLTAHRHQIAVEMGQEPMWLNADATRLEQIIANLLQNAGKYMEDGGNIRLTVEPRPDHVELTVRDQGIGMSADLLPHVFDLFMQGDKSLDRSQGGLGIGLTLARRLVELHGGTIEAASHGPGQGSTFTVRLPTLPTAPADAVPSQCAAGASPPPHRRVLVVDDNLDAATSLAMVLRLEGHEVSMAHDGPTALAAIALHRPEVVFLDIGLPGMSGYEVARRARQDGSMNDGLLVAMTGYGQDQDRQNCHEAGFDLHLVKPVDPTMIREMLAFPGLL